MVNKMEKKRARKTTKTRAVVPFVSLQTTSIVTLVTKKDASTRMQKMEKTKRMNRMLLSSSKHSWNVTRSSSTKTREDVVSKTMKKCSFMPPGAATVMAMVSVFASILMRNALSSTLENHTTT